MFLRKPKAEKTLTAAEAKKLTEDAKELHDLKYEVAKEKAEQEVTKIFPKWFAKAMAQIKTASERSSSQTTFAINPIWPLDGLTLVFLSEQIEHKLKSLGFLVRRQGYSFPELKISW